MDTNELLTSRGFEAQQMQRRLEELAHRLSDKSAAADAYKEVGPLEKQQEPKNVCVLEPHTLCLNPDCSIWLLSYCTSVIMALIMALIVLHLRVVHPALS